MGNLIYNMTGFSLTWGLNMALETLVSQAYGAGNVGLCAILLNRSRYVLILSLIPICVLLFWTQELLVLFGLNPEASAFARDYVRGFMPAFVISSFIDGTRRFLFLLGKNHVPLIFQFCGTFTHSVLAYYLVLRKGYGIPGICISALVSNTVNLVALCLYGHFNSETTEAFRRPTKEATRNLC